MFEVTYLGVPVKIYSFTGRVIDSTQQLETKVSGSGGGGAIYQGSGAVAPVNISSTTTVHNQFFLIDEDNKEISVKLQNWDISLRTEHTVKVIWAIPGKASNGPFVTVKNFNLNEVSWSNNQLKTVVSACLFKHLMIGFAVSVVIGYLLSSFGLFILGIIATFIYFHIRRNIFAKDLKNKILENFL